MMNRFKRYYPFIVVLIGLIGSFFLPGTVARVSDSRTLDNLIIIGAEPISFDTELKLRLPERIALAANPNTEVLTLTTGQSMGVREAETRAVRELTRFLKSGLLDFAVNECVVEWGTASFVIDMDDPSISMTIWEFRVFDRYSNEVIVTIDDETGIILRLIFQSATVLINSGVTEADEADKDAANASESAAGENNEILPGTNGEGGGADIRDSASNVVAPAPRDEAMHSFSLLLTEIMTEYYEQPVRLGDYQYGGNLAYYRADLYSSGSATNLYGVVRETGFTINEKL